jgi:alpha-tubulin suppressor-like RCC1 family protein
MLQTVHANCFRWGSNIEGQLSDDSLNDRWVPVPMETPRRATPVEAFAGRYHTVVLTLENRILVSGWDGYGQLGSGREIFRYAFTEVESSRMITSPDLYPKAIISGALHNVVQLSNGRLHSWGASAFGQLGDGRNLEQSSPVPVDMAGVLNNKNLTLFDAFRHNLVMDIETGRLYAWGFNSAGQLGDGTRADRLVPESVKLYTNLYPTSVVVGEEHTIALSSGRIIAFGLNSMGQFGDGTYVGRSLPVAVNNSVLPQETLVRVYAGNHQTFVLGQSMTLYAAGSNINGQLGIGSDALTSYFFTKVQLDTGGDPIQSVAAGVYVTLALTKSGKLYGWGNGHHTPILINTNEITDQDTIQSIQVKNYNAIAMMQSGKLYTLWDVEHMMGSLSIDTVIPLQVKTDNIPSFQEFQAVSAGGGHITAIIDVCLPTWIGKGCNTPICCKIY